MNKMKNVVIRDKIIDELEKEILGPGSEIFSDDILNEIIWESPVKRYLTGVLHQQNRVEEEKQSNESEGINEDNMMNYTDSSNNLRDSKTTGNTKGEAIEYDNNIDEAIALTNQLKPSSMGMTFFAKGNIQNLDIDIEYGRYFSTSYMDIKTKFEQDSYEKVKLLIPSDIFNHEKNVISLKCDYYDTSGYKGVGIDEKIKDIDPHVYNLLNKMLYSKTTYKRKHYQKEIKLDFRNSNIIQITYDDSFTESTHNKSIKVFAKKRYFVEHDLSSVSIILVNVKENDNIHDKIFQPRITISSDRNEFNLMEYFENINMLKFETPEERNLRLLFRHKKKYGVGHGTSVDYKVESESKWYIKTCYIPVHEVENMNFEIEGIPDTILSMENLSIISKLSDSEILSNLRILIESYSSWIERNSQTEIENHFKDAFNKNIVKASCLRDRMIMGLNVLENNSNAFYAFKNANLAMLMQRVQSKYIGQGVFKDGDMDTCVEYSGKPISDAKWRSFQLAFVLLTIESIVNDNSDYREVVDLIWVTTGGGKTEAYLGLTAFTIFYRKLTSGNEAGGTAVIMRYTLRLLAAQQFNRASILICACEIIRRNNPKRFGNEPITIGLWIGSSVTPNSNSEAVNEYNKLTGSHKKKKYSDDEYNFQVLACPWCGTPTTPKSGGESYGLKKDKKTIKIHCLNECCQFENELPIKVIDEEIYNNPTTLLFATVDKFAQLPWKGEASSIMGVGDSCNKSPELIIQDELHLISGPLGTIVALYEHALSLILSKKGISPKVIASTATIRNADEQSKNLYNRKVSQFPQAISEIEDSFFVKIDKDKYGRKYVGIMGTGITQTTVEIKTMGKLLQSVINMGLSEEEIDTYFTLIGYFNSIRELGKCTTLVNDDIKDFMYRLSRRNGEKLRRIYHSDELTSRLKSSEIIETLDKLENRFSLNVFEKKDFVNYPSDIVLATNMISVGVDVSRLNGMVVIGQPKLTSEYIQASSRVGRSNPGYVVTIFDSAKARDRSHYENFKTFHNAFYLYVEPTSVTPFSESAIERAIHGVFITLIRHYYTELNTEDSAVFFDPDSESTLNIKKLFINIVRSVDETMVEVVENQINQFILFWRSKIDMCSPNGELVYGKENKNRLLMPFGKDNKEDAWETLQAMRNVDSESKVFIT